jgi:hypothetical protein
MIKITEWTCGNVDVKAELTLPDNMPAGLATLAVEGLTQILQRKPSSAWEKAEAGYEKRPDGFKRNSIPFSEASADKLITGFEAALPDGVKVEFSTTQHVDGDSVKPSAESKDLWAKVRELKGDERKSAFATLMIAVDATDDEGIAACHAHMRAAKKAAALEAKQTLGL